MNIWLITTGETLPIGDERPCRTGILARTLAGAGHQVMWWTTTFDHQTKSFIRQKNTKETLGTVTLFFLHATPGYRKNISARRLINHALVATKFRKAAQKEPKPDIIFCSFPTIELSLEAVRYGSENQVPVIVDVRDLWPDIFLVPFPKWLHPLVKLPLSKYVRNTKTVFSNCTAITAISENYLSWALNYAGREKLATDRVFPLGFLRNRDEPQNMSERVHMLLNLGIDRSKTIVWFVGTFGHTYDLSTVIGAARRLSQKGRDDIQFVFTGDGENREEWSQQAHLLNNVVFTGWLKQSQLSCIAEIASIGLMAYREKAPQSLPNKLFEYMADGIPILSSLQGETRELLTLHKCGLTYEAGNPESLIEKLLTMVGNKLQLRQMGENGKRLFEADFSPKTIYRNLTGYLENHANKKQ